MEQKKQTHIMYGLISGFGMIILGVIFYLLGISFKPGVQYLLYLPFLVGMILNGIAFSKANDAQVTFGNVFGSCFKATMIVTLMIIAWSIASQYLFPDMRDQVFQSIQESMAKKNMSDDQIDKVMAMYKKNWTTFLVAGSLFGCLFLGLIFSLIGAAVAKKTPAPIRGDNF